MKSGIIDADNSLLRFLPTSFKHSEMEREVCRSNGSSGLGCSSSGLGVKIPMRAVLENDEAGNKEKKITGSEAAAGGGGGSGNKEKKITGSEAAGDGGGGGGGGGGSGNIHSSGSTFKCPVCSKSFQSEKAMHGHMRCHPERGWKGINPPPPPPSSTSHEIEIGLSHSIVVSSHHIPPPPPPPPLQPGWLKTGRRGQNRIIDHTSSSPNPNITPSLNQMIYCPSKKLKMDIERGALEDTANKSADADAGGGVSWKEYMETGWTTLLRPRKYKCKTCNKVFPTLQALTGNRSPTMENEYEQSSPTAAPEEEEEGIALLASASSRHAKQQVVGVPKAHKCKICSKAFTTGQALGGHQTTHRNKSSVESDTAPQQEPEPEPVLFLEEAARQSAGPEVALGFDLNQLPPMEEEEQQM